MPMRDGSESGAEDPRVTRTREAVLGASRQLLLAEGSEAITHVRVATAAGVARATVYRHWPTREDLLLATVLSTDMAPALPDASLSVRERLMAPLEQLRRDLEGRVVPLLAMLIERGERDALLRAEKRAVARRAMSPLVRVLEDARAAGSLSGEVAADVAATLLVGPLFFRRLISDEPLTRDLVERIVSDFLCVHGAVPDVSRQPGRRAAAKRSKA